MTKEVTFRNNFLFNLGKKAVNGQRTITNIYKAVLPLYLNQINKIHLVLKKMLIKKISKYQNIRHIICDEIVINNLDVNQFKLISLHTMTFRPLCYQSIVIEIYLHIFILHVDEDQMKNYK